MKEREFSAKIFPEIEKVGIIMRGMSKWGARIKFLFKKKGLDQLQVIYNFISVNDITIKSQYLIYHIDKVLKIVI